MRDSFMHFLYLLVQWTWGILQNTAGLLILSVLILRNPHRKCGWYHGAAVIEWKEPGSMGLGMFIFFGHGNSREAKQALVHEYGHTIQSLVLGPLFLPVIGLPSLLWCNLPSCNRMRCRSNIRYMDFYPELWANHLGEAVLQKPALWN